MARSSIVTLLPLDSYASLMAINQCGFNQVRLPNAPVNACDDIWYQQAWAGPTERLVGRDDIALAVATAEEMIAQALRFWPAPRYVTGEQQLWPRPRRGWQVVYPPIELDWGYVIETGHEDTDEAISLSEPVVYTDRDGDGVLDTATITITQAQLTAANATWDEIAVYYPAIYLDWSPYPRDETWRIRPLRIAVNPTTGNVELTGNRCQFVRPDLWETDDTIFQDDATAFITAVDVYRRYTNPSQPAQLVYQSQEDDCTAPVCDEACQTACVTIEDIRNSIVFERPATYDGTRWSYTNLLNCRLPDQTRTWYLAGYYRRIAGWMESDLLQWNNPTLALAIVRLANTYLPEAPCDCQKTQRRWMRDREQQNINTVDAALAMSAFGNVTNGSIFAWGVVKRLNPRGSGLSL